MFDARKRRLKTQFLSRVKNADARYWYSNSVCPSVRPSVTRAVSKRLNTFFIHTYILPSAYSSPILLVCPALNISAKCGRGHPHPYGGVEYTGGYINFAIFDQLSGYMWRTIQEGHGLTTERYYRQSCALSNGDDLKWPLKSISVICAADAQSWLCRYVWYY